MATVSVYRRRDRPGDPVREGPDHGIFIKDITPRELWPADRVATLENLATDKTLQWFAGGTLDFSPDCRELIHKTRWGGTVRIN